MNGEVKIMGKYNSSLYRVRPLMEHIKHNSESFYKVLKLVGIENIGLPQSFWYDGTECKEKN